MKHYLSGQKRLCRFNHILKTLRWEDYCGLSEWPKESQESLKVKEGGKRGESGGDVKNRQRGVVSLAKKTEKRVVSQELQMASMSWKRQRNDSLLEPPERTSPVNTLVLDLCWSSNVKSCKIINSCQVCGSLLWPQ